MFASLFYVVWIVTVLVGAVACLIAVLVLFISLSGFIIVFCWMWLFRFDCLLLLVLFCCLLISVLRCWVWFALIVGGLLLLCYFAGMILIVCLCWVLDVSVLEFRLLID